MTVLELKPHRRSSGIRIPAWVEEYAQELRSQAEMYQRDWLFSHATLLHRVADDIVARAEAYELEELTIAQAAEESGYSPDYLSRAVAEGRIPNASTGKRRRIRRCDLPRKAPRNGQRNETTAVDEVLGRRRVAGR
jgi:excisionase family DNA binding protein